MFAFIRRVLGFAPLPSTVDAALSTVTSALTLLRAVGDAKVREAEGHAVAAAQSAAAHTAATQEAERADRVHDAIAKLVA